MGRELHEALYRAQELYAKKKLPQALSLLDGYAKEHPKGNHHRLAFMRGIMNYQSGKLKPALGNFQQAVGLWPCYGDAHRNLAVLHHELGQNLLAARSALKAYQLIKPPDPELVYLASVFYLSARKPKLALPWLKKLAAKKQPRKKWLLALVRTHQELNQPHKALAVLRRLLAKYPGDAKLWRLAASLETGLKHYARAAADLEVALRLKEPGKSDWRSLAQLYQAAEVPLKAAGYYRRHFGPKPEAKQWLLLARLYWQATKLDQAKTAAEKALKAKDSLEGRLLLARIHLAQRDYRRAAEAFAHAAELAKPERAARYYLTAGHCALRMDMFPQAGKAFERALQKAPKNKPELAKEAAQALKALKQLKARQAHG